MDTFLVGQFAFLYAFNKIKPKEIVNKCIEFFLDLVVSPRSDGESHWVVRSLQSLEESAERASRELDIRSQLREWDKEFPYLHHELIVRYAAGFLASFVLTSIYDRIRGNGRSRNRRY